MAEGFLDFTDGNILTAAQVDDYLMRQANMRFASAAARDSALSAVLTEGLVAVLEDVDHVTVYTGSAWIVAYQYGAWTAYTPTMFQEDGTGQTITGLAHYVRQGRTITGNNILTITAAGSATNGESIIVSMPAVPEDTTSLNQFCGIGSITDSSVPNVYPVAAMNIGGAFRFRRLDATSSSYVGVDPGFALAVGDIVSFNFQYEAAS